MISRYRQWTADTPVFWTKTEEQSNIMVQEVQSSIVSGEFGRWENWRGSWESYYREILMLKLYILAIRIIKDVQGQEWWQDLVLEILT